MTDGCCCNGEAFIQPLLYPFIFAPCAGADFVCMCVCAGERGQGDAAGGGAAPETGQHATAGGEPDGSGAAQEVHRVVLSQHRQETLRRIEKERERRPPLLLL